MMLIKSKDKIGETKYNNSGSKMTIIEYFNCNNITIEFDNGCIVKNITYGNFKKGSVVSIKCKTVCNIGYLDYIFENLTKSKSYRTWHDMIKRCYSDNIKNCYISCRVDNEWHSFKNFKDWYDVNFYQIQDELMCLDKDILSNENKIYSKNTCVFIPLSLNSILIKSFNYGECLKGVYKDTRRNKFIVECCGKYIGQFEDENEAHIIYKKYKNIYFCEKIKTFKNKIPNAIYDKIIEKYIYKEDIINV